MQELKLVFGWKEENKIGTDIWRRSRNIYLDLNRVQIGCELIIECGDDFNETLTEYEYEYSETDLDKKEIHLTKLRATHRIKTYFLCSKVHEDRRDSCAGDSGGPMVVQR